MRQIKLGRFLQFLALAPLALLFTSCQGIALLDPKGPIGAQERDLIIMSVGLGLIVIIPVFVMVILFSLRYRETNKKATYKPHWEGTMSIEALIWIVPILIIIVLSYLTWTKTIDLDPYKPIASTEKPLKVQVISTDWNWLFIYPDYGVALVNDLVVPAGVPVSFDMTSASVMTSLFIPELGSQMYVMAGMTTHLNLLADHPGVYRGHNMEFSGEGYESMTFETKSVTKEQFDQWVTTAKASTQQLTQDQFDTLRKPQAGLPVTTYGSADPNIFTKLVSDFRGPMGMEMAEAQTAQESNGMAMPSMTHE